MRHKFTIQNLIITSIFLCGSNIYAAGLINPGNIPLETGAASVVKPNVMMILDDSGSMGLNYIGDERGGSLNKHCITYRISTYGSYGSTRNLFSYSCDWANAQNTLHEPPLTASQFNELYYNPNITYEVPPAINTSGPIIKSHTFSLTSVDGFLSNPSVNLDTQLKEIAYCTKQSPTSAELLNSAICKRNGIHNIDVNGTFDFYNQAYPMGTYKYPVEAVFTLANNKLGYFKIIPKEYCDESLVNCSLVKTATYNNEAPVRWCTSSTDATTVSLVTGFKSGKAKCQKNYDVNYKFPRFGRFKRETLKAEEINNYANWYAYYRTRMQVMKSSVGMAFKDVNDKTRVGFITITPGNPVSNTKFLKIDDFTSSHKQNFYNKVYSQKLVGSTPNKEAISRVGRYFAGISTGINSGMIDSSNPDPVQYSCQQNFAVLASDGGSTDNAGFKLDGTMISNEDNINSGYSTRSKAAFDGGGNIAPRTLADVSMYYYKTDLRTSGTLAPNNVPISTNDTNNAQHMVTYTIGFGMNGLLNFTQDYVNGSNPDFEAIKNGTKNWGLSGADDLWHTAVNGRGIYYSAKNSKLLAESLSSTLSSILAQVGSSASATTSSPNITPTDNAIFSSSYRTVNWDGELKSNSIDVNTGLISANTTWLASEMLKSKVSKLTDSRNIKFISNQSGSVYLRDFKTTDMTSSELGLFQNKCSNNQLSQCVDLNATQKSLVDNPINLVNFLRGQSEYEGTNAVNPLFRARENVLGDIVNSSLAYVSNPKNKWIDEGYADFIESNKDRKHMIYVGANDGMLHAFDANLGVEDWAVMPRQTLDKTYKLADKNYATNHEFYVDGTIAVMDAKFSTGWKTVLVSGLNSGGKGYFALDVTDPTSPKPLWEICTDATKCNKVINNMGYSYGNPIITKRHYDGKWVVYLTSGYDGANGSGYVYEIDIENGNLLRTLSINETFSYSNQAGIAKINAFYDDFSKDNRAKYLYAGDLNGNVWKWDLTSATVVLAKKIGVAQDKLGQNQTITTVPEVGKIEGFPVVFVGTGRFLTLADFSNTQLNSIYAIKDDDTELGVLRNNSKIIKQNITAGVTESQSTNLTVDWASGSGWFFDLESEVGERINVEPKLALGVLNVLSNVPGASECSIGGSSWIYQIDFKNGRYLKESDKIIARKTNTGLVVGQIIVQLGSSGGLKNYITDASGAILTVNLSPNLQSVGTVAKKLYWKELKNEK